MGGEPTNAVAPLVPPVVPPVVRAVVRPLVPPPVLTPAFAALLLALLMGLQPITTDLMLPALPALAADLRAPMAPAQLTMSAAILAFGIAQLVWGPVADRVGRRPVLLAGLALYVVASIGAATAGTVMTVVAWRALQGAAMSAAVVCARAMVRDLYEPGEGAMVMARALGGLGLLAIASPLFGGALVTAFGWRAAMAAMGIFAAALGLLVLVRMPETAHHRNPGATRLGPLLRQFGVTLRNRQFAAWALLASCTYLGLFIFLAGAGFVLIDVLGLPPARAGLVMCAMPLSYIAGTLLTRRWLPRLGLVRTCGRGARISLLASGAMALLAITDHRAVWAVMLPCALYALGHGVHMPCGQVGAVAPFPQSAGVASALAGFATALGAFFTGLWLGRALDGTVRPLAIGMGCAALVTALVALTLVRRLDRLDTPSRAP